MNSQIVGFDFGDKSLKMAYFVNGALRNAVSVEVPENMVAGGHVVAGDAMSDFIKETAKENGFSKKDAALIVPSALAYTRTVTLPIMSESQLKYNLPYEFKDYLTEDKNKYVFDYEVLETINNPEGEPAEQRLFACATLKDTINRYETILNRAGFRLKTAVPEEYLYSKLLRGDVGTKEVMNGPRALLDIGQSETRLHVLLNGEYDTKRSFDMGVFDIEKLIADITFSDVHMAHSYKMSNYENVLNNEKCVNFYNRLAVEVLKAVNFYNYNNRDVELKDIYLMGGGAAIEPLVDTIRQVTRVELHSAEELLPKDLRTEDPNLMLRAICCAAGE